MSIGYGIGMLFVGIAAIIVAAIIGYYIINKIKEVSRKIILLGGGGYNPWITLRAWTYNLATLLGEQNNRELSRDVLSFLSNISWKQKPKDSWIYSIIDEPNFFKSL